MPKLRTAIALSRAEFFAMAEAMLLLVWSRVLISLVPLRHWRRHIGNPGSPSATDPDLSPPEQETARLVVRALDRAARNLPLQFVCLPRALTARWMLARRGVHARLHIGIGRTETGEASLHAWLKAGEHWITGYQESVSYNTFIQCGQQPE